MEAGKTGETERREGAGSRDLVGLVGHRPRLVRNGTKGDRETAPGSGYDTGAGRAGIRGAGIPEYGRM